MIGEWNFFCNSDCEIINTEHIQNSQIGSSYMHCKICVYTNINAQLDLMELDSVVQSGLMELDSAMGHQGSVLPCSHWFPLTCLHESQTILDVEEDESAE